MKSVNEMERRLDFLEKENLTLRMRLFHQEDWRANAKPGQDLAKEIVDLKVSEERRSPSLEINDKEPNKYFHCLSGSIGHAERDDQGEN